MIDSQKILTIAIPTYNRAKFLIECLDSVLPQVISNEDKIEFIISDNASTDNTEEIIKEYQNKYPFIKYFKNKSNLGFDGNFMKCFERSTGKYLHMMSSDDIMLPGCVDEILKCINECKNVSLIHLNNCGFNKDFKGIENCYDVRMKLSRNICTKNKDKFIKQVGIYITFLPTLVFNKKYFEQLKNLNQYMGTYFLISHVALLCTKGNRKMVIIKHNCIAGRGGNSGGFNLYKIFVEEWKKVLYTTGMASGYNKETLKEVYISSLKNHISHMIVNIRIGNEPYEFNGKLLVIKNTYMYPSVWLYIYPLIFLSRKSLIVLKKLYKIYKKIILSI